MSRRAVKSSSNAADASGAGAGILVAALAAKSHWPPEYIKAAEMAAPVIAVSLRSLLAWALEATKEYAENRKLERYFNATKAWIMKELANEATSEDHKKKLRKDLERLQTAFLDAHLALFSPRKRLS